jgi:hypothetical protein
MTTMDVRKVLRALSPYALPRRRRFRNGIALGEPGRDLMLESLSVVAIVALLLGLTFQSYVPTLKRFMLTEASNLTVAFKIRMAEAMAVRGVPLQTFDASEGSGLFGSDSVRFDARNFDDVAWQDGEIVFTLAAATAIGMMPDAELAGALPLTLSFRVARTESDNRLVLLCGLAEPPPGFTADPARYTTVPVEFLPAHCRI